MDVNRVLYDCIVGQYGNVVDFSDKSGIPPIELNAVLLKDNVFEEIAMGMNLCRILNIDIDEIVFNSKIKEAAYGKYAGISNSSVEAEENRKNDEAAAKNEIYNKCMRLSEIEKKKVLEYIDGIIDKNRNQDEN